MLYSDKKGLYLTGHLAKKLPYEGTEIPPERTKADIDSILHEFVILDDHGNRTCHITAIRWTDIPPSLPILEFMVEYIHEGVKKGSSIRIKPPLLIRRKRQRGGHVNTEAPAQSMRLFYWYLKSKLEAILFGLNDLTSEFLNEVIISLPSGKDATVGEIIVKQIQDSKIPALTFNRET